MSLVKSKHLFNKKCKFSLLYRIASPFLDVLEEIIAEDDAHQDGQEDSDEEMMESDEAEMNFVHYNKCISGEQFTETDEEDEENQGIEDVEDNESDDEEVMCEEDI